MVQNMETSPNVSISFGHLHLTYHVYQIRHDAFNLNNVNVLNLQTREKNY